MAIIEKMHKQNQVSSNLKENRKLRWGAEKKKYMLSLNTKLLILTLNVNSPNTTERNCQNGLKREVLCCIQEKHFIKL